MAPSTRQREQAESLKAEGNSLFSKGKYGAAADLYTEGITLDPSYAVLYVNRALCYKKSNRWEQVAKDAQTALGLSRDLMKAHYLLGVAQREIGQLSEGISHLSKALEQAREKGDSIKDEIWRELARTKYQQWQQDSQARTATVAALKQQLQSMLQAQRLQGEVAGAAAGCGPGGDFKGSPEQQQQAAMQQWEELLQRAAHLDSRTEVPTAFTCPLTMEVFREPVITPSGCSYERSALLEHLAKVGKFDPISRQPMSEADITLNVGLRNATQQYLDEHPWAWGEVV
ncbi:hypothetical protein OEZ85_010792 [Tetradesmus obliquus]|uniref:E3 ubiquitin-protein ligase CHIP n=1 Tax=Tetradesmus obliquus TaxID=3088 RepID=A0ABY8TNR4_TETOB|nr:hypothetical protein OEZ85_010792 [Tetradesmus obliquus]